MISFLSQNLLRFSLLIFLMFLITPALSAQIAGGLNETTSTNWGGNNFITGRVFYPDGSPVNARIPIRLQSMRGEINAVTDDSGKFVFSRIPNGTYTFYVEGDKNFESASQEVEVTDSRGSVNISIRLKYKAKLTAKPGVINADELQIPKKALEIYRKAVKLDDSKDHQAAVEQLKLAIAEHPTYLDAFNELGVQYMKLNDLEKAREALESAIKIKTDAFEPLVNYGIVLFRLKNLNEAEIVFRAALTIKKQSPVAHYYLGRLLTAFNRFDEAEKEFKLALSESENKMVEVHRMLANLYLAKGDHKRAVKELEKYLELSQNAADAEKLRKIISELKNAKPSAKPIQPKP